MSSTTYTITEARARLSELLRRAKAGEEIVITKGHEPQARILPPHHFQPTGTCAAPAPPPSG